MQRNGQIGSRTKTPFLKSCLVTVVSIIFGLSGFVAGIAVIWFAYVFVQSHMIHSANMLAITAGGTSSIILIFLAFRLKKQLWYLTLGSLLLVWFVLSPVSFFLINYSTDRLVMVSGSMKPALLPGDYFIVDKLAYKSTLPQRGDIVLYSRPFNQADTRIARVVGLPGENIQMKAGQIWIDGAVLQEPHDISMAAYSGQWETGDAGYFLLGDNRNASSDSHILGMIPVKSILGKVTYIYYPFSRYGSIINNHPTP